MTGAASAARDHNGCLGHTVERIHGARVEAIRRKRAVEPFDRIGMDRLGCINGDLPRREIESFRGFGAETAHAQIERKIRHAGDLAAILLDSLQPDYWALHECGGGPPSRTKH